MKVCPVCGNLLEDWEILHQDCIQKTSKEYTEFIKALQKAIDALEKLQKKEGKKQ